MMDIKKIADILSEKHYDIVKSVMTKYHLSDNDIPDWHGAIATAIVKCAAHSAECFCTEEEAEMKFNELINGFVLYEICFERPLADVCKVARMIHSDMSMSSVYVFMELCRKYGGDGVIASRLFYSV